jgi:hypothetical protein
VGPILLCYQLSFDRRLLFPQERLDRLDGNRFGIRDFGHRCESPIGRQSAIAPAPRRKTGQERKGAYEYQRDLGSPVSPPDDVGDCADQLCQSSPGTDRGERPVASRRGRRHAEAPRLRRVNWTHMRKISGPDTDATVRTSCRQSSSCPPPRRLATTRCERCPRH